MESGLNNISLCPPSIPFLFNMFVCRTPGGAAWSGGLWVIVQHCLSGRAILLLQAVPNMYPIGRCSYPCYCFNDWVINSCSISGSQLEAGYEI